MSDEPKRCPSCGAVLEETPDLLICPDCGRKYPNVPDYKDVYWEAVEEYPEDESDDD